MELSAQLQRFVQAYVSTGKLAESYRIAGYKSDEYAKQGGYRLAQKPHVREAILRETWHRVTVHVPLALGVLVEVAEDKGAPHAARVAAAEKILNLGGLRVAERHELILKDERSDVELQASIRAHAEELGLSVIDGELIEDEQAPSAR